MKFAFHKDQSTLFARLVSWKMGGPYSHVEAVFEPNADGTFVCASSAFLDGGVRFKNIALPADKWDVIDVPGLDPERLRQWFKDHAGEPYDVRGLLDFVLPFPVGNCKRGWFCDEACAAAMGLHRSAHFDPNDFAAILEYVGGTWAQPLSLTTA